jgi:3-hydroxyisobutyrate dehydrogenase
MDVAVVGLGEMGGAIAANLVSAGHGVAVYDLDAERVDLAVRTGCRSTGSAAEAARRAEVLHIVVFTDVQARAVVLGGSDHEGALNAMAPGSVLVVHSTIPPATCRELGEIARVQDVEVIDAGMTGTGEAARAGEMTLLVGGAEAAVERCRDELAAFAADVLHVGSLGSGMVAKIVNNISVLANAEVARQLLALGVAAGLGWEEVLRVLNAGTGRSWVTENWGKIRRLVESPDDGSTYAGMARKDCALALALATDADAPLPIGEAVSRRLRELDATRRTERN